MIFNKKKGIFVKTGRSPTYDKVEVLRLYREYEVMAVWENEEDTMLAFSKKHNIGYDTIRRYLGKKPQNWRRVYPKKKHS